VHEIKTHSSARLGQSEYGADMFASYISDITVKIILLSGKKQKTVLNESITFDVFTKLRLLNDSSCLYN
jgi:hypothetical protein